MHKEVALSRVLQKYFQVMGKPRISDIPSRAAVSVARGKDGQPRTTGIAQPKMGHFGDVHETTTTI